VWTFDEGSLDKMPVTLQPVELAFRVWGELA
jgi:hypothetical protein